MANRKQDASIPKGFAAASPRIVKSDGVTVDEFGFVRPRTSGTVSVKDLRRMMNAAADDDLVVLRAGGGRRVETVSGDSGELRVNAGDRLARSPSIVKAAVMSEDIRREIAGLKAAGLRDAQRVESPAGAADVRIRLRGLTLANGARTDALVLLPLNFPAAAPIGFYVRKGAHHALDEVHLFETRTFHGAPDLSAQGWAWFCAVPRAWKPGRHSLAGWVLAAIAFLNGDR